MSGGLDSTTAIAVAQHEHDIEVKIGVSVLYGQKHHREIQAARDVAEFYAFKHFTIDIRGLGALIQESSALLNPDESLPHDRALSEMTARVPRSYVPGRNTIMLAIAQSIAEAYELDTIICGFNAVDYSGYPDTRRLYVEAWNHLARYATKVGSQGKPIQVIAPIIDWSKAHIVQAGIDLKVPFELTWSCYLGSAKACGHCDSCLIRWNAFRTQGLTDPIEYEHIPKEQI